MISSQIEDALHELVPTHRRRDIVALAQLLASAATGEQLPDDVGRTISSDPRLLLLLGELVGARVNANGTTVGFNGDTIVVGSIQDSEAIAIGRNAIAIKLELNLTSSVPSDQINRRKQMISSVRQTWITGVLDHSLKHIDLIRLNVAVQSNYGVHPWRLIGQYVGQPAQPLPPDAGITDVFMEMGKQLLIIGEAGSGKTTALLTLAKELLSEAEKDPYSPIPVIFSLASFSMWWGTFTEWLVTELNIRYQVSLTTAHHWIATGGLLLLLDGLDEVAEHRREDCVAALNRFRRTEYGLDQIVVCSRIDEYRNLQQKLLIPAIVNVLPLTSDQLRHYLASGGDRIAPIRALLDHDSQLAEMTQTPLMLNMILLAYANMTRIPVLMQGSLEMQRAQIFEHYIGRMLSYPEGERIYGIDLPNDTPDPPKPAYTPDKFRRWIGWLTVQMKVRGKSVRLPSDTPDPPKLPYTPDKIRCWIGWLATQMKARDKSLFLVEDLQPDWLAPQDRWQYLLLLIPAMTLFLGLVGGFGRWLAFTPALGFLLGVTGIWRWGGLLLFVYGLLVAMRAVLFGFPDSHAPLFAFDAALV